MRLLFACLLAGFFVPAAEAVQRCAPLELITRTLRDRYDELPAARGTTARGALVILFRNEAADTWTLVAATHPSGACIVAAGENWRAAAPKAPEEGT